MGNAGVDSNRLTSSGRDATQSSTCPDQVLLRRFVGKGDEQAFEAIVHRHGAMVLDVCRGLLAKEADVEDAFQATFLVLTCKAASIRKAASLGSWLHGVAYRTARKAQAEFAKRQKHEARVPERSAAEPADELTWKELRQVVHEELHALSDRLRAPLVLCYLQGKTQDQASLELGLPKGTLKGRVERGRALLRVRLARRGLGPAAVLVAAAWPAAAVLTLPASLLGSTVQAVASVVASGTATGVLSANVTALAQGVMKTMFVSKIKAAAALLLVMSAGVATAATWKMQNSIPMPGNTQTPGLAISADGKMIATGHLSEAKLWDAATGQELMTLPFAGSTVSSRAVALSPDGKVLAGVDYKEVKLWDTATGGDLATLSGHEAGIHCVAFSPDGKTLATGSNEETRTVRLWDVAAAKESTISLKASHCVMALAFAPDGKTLAVGFYEGRITLFDTAAGKQRTSWKAHGDWAMSLAFSPDGKLLASGCRDGTAKLWNTAGNKELASWRAHPKHTRLAFSPDGKTIVTGGHHDQTVRLWDVREPDTAKIGEIQAIEDHTEMLWSVAFAPNGSLVTAGDDAVRLWKPNKPAGRR